MKIIVLILFGFSLTSGNPGANSKEWRWISKTPKVTPNMHAGPFPETLLPPTKMTRVPGSWRAANCGPTLSSSPAIVGGQEAVPHSFPWQVGLFIDTFYFCGGSLLSNDWVLTAAHCTTGSQSIEVVLGAHNIQVAEPSQVTIVSTGADIITHPNYIAATLTNDLGLVHLSSPVTFTNEIQPICLPSYSDSDLGVGVTVTASGWGLTVDGGQTSDVLKEATVATISNADCEGVYGSVVTSATVCTSYLGSGTCNGDSGGPLNYVSGGQTFNRGVTSFVATAGCTSGYPDGFTRTTHYLDWIEATTGIAIDP